MSFKYHETVQELKRLLLDEKDLAAINTYFFKHLGNDRDFMQLGMPKDDPKLLEMIECTASTLSPESSVVGQPYFVYVPKFQLYHGTCHVIGRQASVFYFDDLKKGMLAVLSFGGSTDYLRLSEASLRRRMRNTGFSVAP